MIKPCRIHYDNNFTIIEIIQGMPLCRTFIFPNISLEQSFKVGDTLYISCILLEKIPVLCTISLFNGDDIHPCHTFPLRVGFNTRCIKLDSTTLELFLRGIWYIGFILDSPYDRIPVYGMTYTF